MIGRQYLENSLHGLYAGLAADPSQPSASSSPPAARPFIDEPFIEQHPVAFEHRDKRQRVRGKQQDRCVRIGWFKCGSHIQLRLQDPGAFLPHGWGAVLVDALESSRLSRELDCVLYTVDWGMKGARQAYFDALMMPAKSLKEAAGARVRLFSFFFVFIPHLL